MVQSPIHVEDKNGFSFVFRTPNSDEAQVVLDAMAEIAASSPYILSTAESFRSIDLKEQVKWIESCAKSAVSVIIAVYESSGRLIGLCNGRCYSDPKRKHRAALGVSIHPNFRGQGLGKKLMEVLINNIKSFTGIKIIELDVMAENLPAIKMYESLGFKRGGLFPKAFILPDGRTIDNLTMYADV